MLLIDLGQEIYFSLSANKSRSILTILGIVIGIASVITMISIGQGATKEIEANIQSLGSNLLIVTPGSQQGFGSLVRGGRGSATTLVEADAKAIAGAILNIDSVAPTVSTRQQVKTSSGANTNASIYGVDDNYAPVSNLTVAAGGFLTPGHVSGLSKVAVVGPAIRDELFGADADPLGQKIRIGSLEFSIIGLTASKGGSGFGSSDDLVYIPISVAQRYFTGSNSLNNISIQVSRANLMAAAQDEISRLLLTRHKIADPAQADFSIINQADIINTVTAVSGTLTLLLGAIAGISLLVGGIGIMNMMLTTVTERTKEIGLRKSLGAKNNDINLQFLAEAVALTFCGGIIGIALGWGASLLVTRLSGTATVVTSFSVLLAFSVAAGIGIIFGYYPARRAARLNPIEALRYE